MITYYYYYRYGTVSSGEWQLKLPRYFTNVRYVEMPTVEL